MTYSPKHEIVGTEKWNGILGTGQYVRVSCSCGWMFVSPAEKNRNRAAFNEHKAVSR